jgi:hypothetical protein
VGLRQSCSVDACLKVSESYSIPESIVGNSQEGKIAFHYLLTRYRILFRGFTSIVRPEAAQQAKRNARLGGGFAAFALAGSIIWYNQMVLVTYFMVISVLNIPEVYRSKRVPGTHYQGKSPPGTINNSRKTCR